MTIERQRIRHSSAWKAFDLEPKAVLNESLEYIEIGVLAHYRRRFTDPKIETRDLVQVIRRRLKAWKPRSLNQEVTTCSERKGIDKRQGGSTYCTSYAEYRETPLTKFDQDLPQRG